MRRSGTQLAGGPSRIDVSGPLAPFATGFRAELTERGFTRWVVAQHTHLMAHLSSWLVEQGLTTDQVTTEALEEYLADRRDEGAEVLVSRQGMTPLLEYLRGLAVVPAPVERAPVGPVEELLASYRTYLLLERGLTSLSVERYLRVAHLFFSRLPAPVDAAAFGVTLAELPARQVTDFLLIEVSRVGTWAARSTVTALRALLRYLHLAGHLPRSLSSAVPQVAGWGLSALPRAVPVEQVARLLAACDRTTPLGLRDYAIVLVLSRLGLRNGEVAHLDLDDLDWDVGEVLVRGKGGRNERLPLPVDVGQALVDYLTQGRPKRSTCRRVFVIHRAPYTGMALSSVGSVVVKACEQAGVEPISPHRLRHTTASDLLARGAGLVEVGQLLRHQAQTTTAIYAKLDHHALGELVRPWPGVS